MKYLTTAFLATFLSLSLFIGCGEETENGVESKNYPPIIDRISSYGTAVKQGASMPFIVSTTDYEKDPLEYTWESTAGGFDKTSEKSVVWTAPNESGDVEITVSVNDGKNDPVTATVTITVVQDKGIASELIGTWNLVSVDGHPLPYYTTPFYIEVTGVQVFPIKTKYSSVKYSYKHDGTVRSPKATLTRTRKFVYIFPTGAIIPDKGVTVDGEDSATGRYELSDSSLKIDYGRNIDTETTYDESRYNENQREFLEEQLEWLEEETQDLFSNESVEITSIENDKMECVVKEDVPMEWDPAGSTLIYEKILVKLKYE